ncbi:MAG: hypothetical protein DWQ36_17125 [Acidobacteria bacterium]|mgnify:CR=1 FL=1|nr:MAG: hypothetical protein DWQ30_05220 [Acidobacteriota bacterium]REK04573.1 MAG: hypothetical protein DWQ36_17125 [Acidobacteriota bacterium]
MNYRRFLRNLLLAFVPVVVVWLVLTPLYDRFLIRATENAVRLIESPDQTTLKPHETHYALIYRGDLRGQTSTGHVYSLRVTDIHFPVLLLAAMFLAVPGVALRERAIRLAWALLFSVFFHLLSMVFWVQFAYATQLGNWSMENYSALGRNFWGLGKHLLDLPFKFAWPLVLWFAFFGSRLLTRRGEDESQADRA